MRKRTRLRSTLLCSLLTLSFLASVLPAADAEAAWMPDHDVGAYAQKNMFETERVHIGKLPVMEVTNATMHPPATQELMEPVHFVIYNSTLQEIEQEVTSSNGELPELWLIKDHNYTIYAEDANYRMPNKYVWVREDGTLTNIKDIENRQDQNGNWYSIYNYGPITELELYKRENWNSEADSDMRVSVQIPLTPALYNRKVTLVSDVEKIETSTGEKGRIDARLLEDTNYMVVIEDENWGLQAFPISVKDKSEYGAGKYTYNHADCSRVDNLTLVNKKEIHAADTVLTNTDYDTVYQTLPGYASLKGHTTITGMNFRDLLVQDRKLDKSTVSGISSLKGKDFDVLDIRLINPHRWEYTKLAIGDYKVTEQLDSEKPIQQVYYLDKNNELQKVNFIQNGSSVTFDMTSLSIYPIVIEYREDGASDNPDPGTEPDIDPGTEPKPDVTLPYMDVAKSDWFFAYAAEMYQRGLMKGMDDTHFGTMGTLKRAHAITILYRMDGAPPVTYTDSFTDVNRNDWYASATIWAKANGISTGYQDGRFGGNDAVTREQFAALLYRYAKSKGYDVSQTMDISHFPDVSSIQFGTDAISWCVSNKIISGDNGYLKPQANAKREECAAMISRFLKTIEK